MKIELPKDVKRPGEMCVLVYGGQDFRDEDVIFDALDLALMQCEARNLHLTIVQSGAPGADQIASSWANYQDGEVSLITEQANWNVIDRSNWPGPRHNQLMIDKYNPDYFISVPGNGGAIDMAKRCKKAGIPGAVYRDGLDL